MAAKNHGNDSKKRKRIPGAKGDVKKFNSKKSKFTVNSPNKNLKKHFNSSKYEPAAKPKFEKPETVETVPKTKREARLQAKV